MTEKRKTDRIDQLLNMAWNTKSTARTLAIVNQILEIDPDNVDALIMKADNTENPAEATVILARALEALNSSDESDSEEKTVLLYVLNQRLAFTLFYDNKFTESLSFCEAALKYGEDVDDPEAEGMKSALKSRGRESWLRLCAMKNTL